MNNKNLIVIIMAAGKGTRMKSTLPKVLHPVAGKTLLEHVLINTSKINPYKLFIIVGYKADSVKKVILENKENIDLKKLEIVEQIEQLGTGHAIMQVEPLLDNFEGDVIIVSGDVPLLTSKTLLNLYELHIKNKSAVTILSTKLENPTSYGRIIRDNNNNVIKIVEEKDATLEEKFIKEINSGTYCFNWLVLKQALKQINNNNAQKEYYLTDTIHIIKEKNQTILAHCTDNPVEVLGVNDRVELANISNIIYKRINEDLMRSGVSIIDPNSTYIDYNIEIGKDTIIYPQTFLMGNTKIGSNCIIGPCCQLTNTVVGDNTKVIFSVTNSCKIGSNTQIGPYTQIREGSFIDDNCRIGNFVELKKANLKKGVKASHLSYLGDVEIGSDSNIGAGTITCNYDGKNKHKTLIGERVFVGSNSSLVAPVILENNSYIGSGSVITKDVPEGNLAIARGKQRNIEGWVNKKFKKYE